MVFAILVVEIALAIIAYTFRSAFKETWKAYAFHTMHKFQANQVVWDYIQPEVRAGNKIYIFFLFFLY